MINIFVLFAVGIGLLEIIGDRKKIISKKLSNRRTYINIETRPRIH